MKNRTNKGNFTDLSGQNRELNIEAQTNLIKIDNVSTGVTFSRSAKKYYSSKNGESIDTISQLGNVVEFCKNFLKKNPTFA